MIKWESFARAFETVTNFGKNGMSVQQYVIHSIWLKNQKKHNLVTKWIYFYLHGTTTGHYQTEG